MSSESKNDLRMAHIEGPHNEKLANYSDIAGQLVDVDRQGSIQPDDDRRCLRRIDIVLMPSCSSPSRYSIWIRPA